MTKPLKFPKGLQVQYIGHEECGPHNLFGVVVTPDGVGASVRFPKWTGGWQHEDKGPANCWYCSPDELKITEPTQTKLQATKPSQAYKGNGKHTWEMVTGRDRTLHVASTTRLRVPGGWLYKPYGSASVFVPMPEVVKHKV